MIPILIIFTLGLSVLRNTKSSQLLVKIVLTLSNGQASVECSFTFNKSVLNYNITEDSIVAKKAIRDHMLSNGLEPQSIVISNQLVWFVSGACQKYQDYLGWRKATQTRLTKVNITERDWRGYFEMWPITQDSCISWSWLCEIQWNGRE